MQPLALHPREMISNMAILYPLSYRFHMSRSIHGLFRRPDRGKAASLESAQVCFLTIDSIQISHDHTCSWIAKTQANEARTLDINTKYISWSHRLYSSFSLTHLSLFAFALAIFFLPYTKAGAGGLTASIVPI